MGAQSKGETGLSFRDPAILAVAHLAAGGGHLSPAWAADDEIAIRDAAARQLSGHAHAAELISSAAERLCGGIELVSFLEPGGPFGPAWAGHPFASPAMLVGYKLREPDFTSELAALMGPAGGRHAARRAVSFLRVLAEQAGADGTLNVLHDTTRPNVISEQSISRPRRRSTIRSEVASTKASRIDLLFEWPAGSAGQRAIVIVEAKLGATVSDGQLRPYRTEALRRAKGGPVLLILLTAWKDLAEQRNRTWTALRWFTVLRRWESALADAGDDDPEFARVRAHLWRFVLARRKAHQ